MTKRELPRSVVAVARIMRVEGWHKSCVKCYVFFKGRQSLVFFLTTFRYIQYCTELRAHGEV